LRIRNSVEIKIVNKCTGITLGAGTCTILKGRDKHEFQKAIPPLEKMSTVIKSKHSIGRTKWCMIYELIDSKSPTTPLWWEYRVFLAVGAATGPFSDNNRATAILFKIKDRAFNGGRKDIDNLREDILQHSTRRPHKATTWNVGGRALLLSPEFSLDVPASVTVVLEQSHLSIERDPIFHRTRAFA
jgi:hypothetical protein